MTWISLVFPCPSLPLPAARSTARRALWEAPVFRKFDLMSWALSLFDPSRTLAVFVNRRVERWVVTLKVQDR